MGKIIDGVIKLVVAGFLGLLLVGFLMDFGEKQNAEEIQGEYLLTGNALYNIKFIVKADKTVRAKQLLKNGESISPWIPGYWEVYPGTTADGHTIYEIRCDNDWYYWDLEANYATETLEDMKSKVPMYKIKKVK